MNYKEIMELSQWLEKSAFTQYSVSVGGVHVSMSKQQHVNHDVHMQNGNIYQAPSIPAAPPVVELSPIQSAISEPQAVAHSPESAKGHIVVSPIVGTYYESSNPESAPLVRTGQSVKKGDVLCILEAMKIMNEITADVDGVVVEIFVKNGEMVEARQSLFRIEV